MQNGFISEITFGHLGANVGRSEDLIVGDLGVSDHDDGWLCGFGLYPAVDFEEIIVLFEFVLEDVGRCRAKGFLGDRVVVGESIGDLLQEEAILEEIGLEGVEKVVVWK